MNIHNIFTVELDTKYPVIMAPMFLVSNEAMIKAAMGNGIAGVFPSLNFRRENELKGMLERLNGFKNSPGANRGNYGVNLAFHKTHPLFARHLQDCVDARVPFYIVPSGSPEQVIEAAHGYGGKVLCDAGDLKQAERAAAAGCDGFIAVSSGAGGHAGRYPLHVLIPALKEKFPGKILVAAGAIANGRQVAAAMLLGASGVSVGTRFIASREAPVNAEYKEAILKAGMEDIVLSEKLSGFPANIINTPYAQTIGHRLNPFEKFLAKNPLTKKYVRAIKKSLLKDKNPGTGNYDRLWSAGQSVELVREIASVAEIVASLVQEFDAAREEFAQTQST